MNEVNVKKPKFARAWGFSRLPLPSLWILKCCINHLWEEPLLGPLFLPWALLKTSRPEICPTSEALPKRFPEPSPPLHIGGRFGNCKLLVYVTTNKCREGFSGLSMPETS